MNQRSSVVVNPESIINRFTPSTDEMSGVTTVIAKTTLPALSEILESRANWSDVNTGSLSTNTMPDRIPPYRSTDAAIPSNEGAFPFIRKAYAADRSASSGHRL